MARRRPSFGAAAFALFLTLAGWLGQAHAARSSGRTRSAATQRRAEAWSRVAATSSSWLVSACVSLLCAAARATRAARARSTVSFLRLRTTSASLTKDMRGGGMVKDGSDEGPQSGKKR